MCVIIITMNFLLKIFFLALFCFSIFDCLASSDDSLRSDDEIAPFLGLKSLTYRKKVKTPGNEFVPFDVPLVIVSGSSIDRNEELKKCKYLRGVELCKDWGSFDRGHRTWLDQSRYLVLDTEVNSTTFEGEIIEICLLEFINGKASGLEFSTFIRPHSRVFSKYSQKVHGITYSKLLDKPFFSQIAEQLKTFIGDSVVIAHNAAFDIRMLAQEYERLETTDIIKFYYKCTFQMHCRDEWRDRNPDKIKSSPFKKRTVRYVSKRERAEIAAEKRAIAKARKRKTQEKKRERELDENGGQINKRQKTTAGNTEASLGFFIRSRQLTNHNVPSILDVQTDLSGQHHNARFDTYVGAAKVKEFQQKEIEKDIRFSQDGNDENDPNALNGAFGSQASSITQSQSFIRKSSAQLFPLAPIDLNGTM